MSKGKPWTHLFSTLRRARPTPRFRFHSASPVHSADISTIPSFSNAENENTTDALRRRRCLFPDNSRFSGKSYCSESAGKLGDARCWNCDALAGTTLFLFCESCKSIQPVDASVDYFQIFGLKKNYEVNVDNLDRKYKDWQKKLHPDLVHSKSEREREYAAQQSARVIDAYRMLKTPLSRAIYILRLEGVDVDEEQTISEPDLLAEIMEIREAVEEAGDSQALNQIKSQMQEKLKHWSESLANAFQSRKFEEAKASIQRMTYYERVNEEIEKKL